jgi:hypothetical protein
MKEALPTKSVSWNTWAIKWPVIYHEGDSGGGTCDVLFLVVVTFIFVTHYRVPGANGIHWVLVGISLRPREQFIK